MRKGKVFSVSMMEEEVAELDDYLKEFQVEVGVKLSRNELVRKAALAFVRTTKAKKNKNWEFFEKEFKYVGCEKT